MTKECARRIFDTGLCIPNTRGQIALILQSDAVRACVGKTLLVCSSAWRMFDRECLCSEVSTNVWAWAADRQRTLRELVVGKTLVCQDGRWLIRHGAGDYKTGRSYGERPPLVVAGSIYPEVQALAVAMKMITRACSVLSRLLPYVCLMSRCMCEVACMHLYVSCGDNHYPQFYAAGSVSGPLAR